MSATIEKLCLQEILIDTDAEMNIMSEEIWRKTGLAMDQNVAFRTYSAVGDEDGMTWVLGVCRQALVICFTVAIKTPIWVVRDLNWPCILRMPYIRKSKMQQWVKEDGTVNCKIYGRKGTYMEFTSVSGENPRNYRLPPTIHQELLEVSDASDEDEDEEADHAEEN